MISSSWWPAPGSMPTRYGRRWLRCWLRWACAYRRRRHDCLIDEGFDFLGFRIRAKPSRDSNKKVVYTWPSRKALASIMAK